MDRGTEKGRERNGKRERGAREIVQVSESTQAKAQYKTLVQGKWGLRFLDACTRGLL
jgi:hypothetical protein